MVWGGGREQRDVCLLRHLWLVHPIPLGWEKGLFY